MSGIKSEASDPLLEEAESFGQQALQPHQDAAITAAEANLITLGAALLGARAHVTTTDASAATDKAESAPT